MLHEVTVLILSTGIIQGIFYILLKNKAKDDAFVGLCIFVPLSCTIIFSLLRFFQDIWPQIVGQLRKDLGFEQIPKSKREVFAKERYETPIVFLLITTFFLFSACVTVNTFKEDRALLNSASSAYDYYGVKRMSDNVWFESTGLQKVFATINLAIFSFLIINVLLQSIGAWNIRELYTSDEKQVSNTASTTLKFTLTFLLHTITRAYNNIFNVSCATKALDGINTVNLLQSKNVLYLEMGSIISSQFLLVILFVLAVLEAVKKWNLSPFLLYFTTLYAISFDIILTICLFDSMAKKQMDGIFVFTLLLPILISVYLLDIYNFVVSRLKIESDDEEADAEDSQWEDGERISKTKSLFPFASFIDAQHFMPKRRFD